MEKQSAVIVPHLGKIPIRPGHSGKERRRPLQSAGDFVPQRLLPHSQQKRCTVGCHIGAEAVVGSRPFKIRTLFIELFEDLILNLPNGKVQPGPGRGGGRQEGRAKQQSGNIRQVVVGGQNFRPLQVVENMVTVLINGGDKNPLKVGVYIYAQGGKQGVSQHQIGGSDAHIHRTHPVHPHPGRVLRKKIQALAPEFPIQRLPSLRQHKRKYRHSGQML